MATLTYSIRPIDDSSGSANPAGGTWASGGNVVIDFQVNGGVASPDTTDGVGQNRTENFEITWTATDAEGYSASATSTVELTDTCGPVFGNNFTHAQSLGSSNYLYLEETYTLTDTYSIDIDVPIPYGNNTTSGADGEGTTMGTFVFDAFTGIDTDEWSWAVSSNVAGSSASATSVYRATITNAPGIVNENSGGSMTGIFNATKKLTFTLLYNASPFDGYIQEVYYVFWGCKDRASNDSVNKAYAKYTIRWPPIETPTLTWTTSPTLTIEGGETSGNMDISISCTDTYGDAIDRWQIRADNDMSSYGTMEWKYQGESGWPNADISVTTSYSSFDASGTSLDLRFRFTSNETGGSYPVSFNISVQSRCERNGITGDNEEEDFGDSNDAGLTITEPQPDPLTEYWGPFNDLYLNSNVEYLEKNITLNGNYNVQYEFTSSEIDQIGTWANNAQCGTILVKVEGLDGDEHVDDWYGSDDDEGRYVLQLARGSDTYDPGNNDTIDILLGKAEHNIATADSDGEFGGNGNGDLAYFVTYSHNNGKQRMKNSTLGCFSDEFWYGSATGMLQYTWEISGTKLKVRGTMYHIGPTIDDADSSDDDINTLDTWEHKDSDYDDSIDRHTQFWTDLFSNDGFSISVGGPNKNSDDGHYMTSAQGSKISVIFINNKFPRFNSSGTGGVSDGFEGTGP